MMKARPMRMTPPPQLPGLAGCSGPGWRDPVGATFLMEVFHLQNSNKRSFEFCYKTKAAVKVPLFPALPRVMKCWRHLALQLAMTAVSPR